MNIVQASGLNQLESFLGILLPKRSQQIPQHLANVPLLISAHVTHPNPIEPHLLSGQLDRLIPLLSPTLPAKRRLPLLPIEHLINLARSHRLIPVRVSLVFRLLSKAIRRVPIKKRTSKGHPLHRVPITTSRAMPPRQHKLKLSRSRRPKNRHR